MSSLDIQAGMRRLIRLTNRHPCLNFECRTSKRASSSIRTSRTSWRSSGLINECAEHTKSGPQHRRVAIFRKSLISSTQVHRGGLQRWRSQRRASESEVRMKRSMARSPEVSRSLRKNNASETDPIDLLRREPNGRERREPRPMAF